MGTQMETLTTGSLAYIDTLTDGLVPCRVTAIRSRTAFDHGTTRPSSDVVVDAIITKRTRLFDPGERVSYSSVWVFPRKAVSFRKLGTRIRAYNVAIDA